MLQTATGTLQGRAQELATIVIAFLANSEEAPSIERVAEVMKQMRLAIPVTDEEFVLVEKFVHTQRRMSMGKGVVLAPKFEKWLLHRKATITPYYWERYRQYLLSQGFGPAVVRQMDKITDDLLDYCGDPHAAVLDRRGLVVGNVQSGKTATYTALINKAADTGYRVIILLAGTLNSLRHQTQVRLDEGFVGFDTAVIRGNHMQRGAAAIGVGRYANTKAPFAFTSKVRDFDANYVGVRGRLEAMNEPVLMVIKKNKTILENLYGWLADQNPASDGKIHVPVLLIDDEADAASPNTGPETDPRAINAGIRNLLALFSKSSYVGFTATPFANIFISPNSATEMLKNDLFPRDYIYSLEPPTNYIGPVKMFQEEAELFIRTFDDAELIFPKGHKKELIVERLPQSMLDSLASFLIVNAVRDLRSQAGTHRSMLVNVSWANNVQHQVAELLRTELEAIVRDIETYYSYSADHALARSDAMRHLHKIFEREHANADVTWADVQHVLYDAVRTVTVRTVNMSSGTSRLDYEAYKSQGFRVIAVGGNALSRGLTLEGLSTSYIYRNSKAYDTLLQMGRWFGYRPGYEDLCRVWMSEESLDWYKHITDATEELRAEFRHMHDAGQTPRTFGLRVRAHPEALIVTARNKMRGAAQVFAGAVSFSHRHVEFKQLVANDDVHCANLAAAERLLQSVLNSGATRGGNAGQRRYLWRGVPKALIANFLAAFRVFPGPTFPPQQIARFLTETDVEELSKWDVAIPSGSAAKVTVADLEIVSARREMRQLSSKFEPTGRRLGSEHDEAIGLTEERRRLAVATRDKYSEAGDKLHPLSVCYRERRTHPLLLLYFIEPTRDKGLPWVGPPETRPIVSAGLSFPRYNDENGRGLITYETNQVWQEMRLDFEPEIDEDEQLESIEA